MWKDKKGTVHYNSFEELSNNNKKKNRIQDLEAKQKKFVGVCKICKEPMTWIPGTNVVSCTNPECKGIEVKKKDVEGEDVIIHIPVNRVISSDSMGYAERLFG